MTTRFGGALRSRATRFTAIGFALVLYVLARQPQAGESERTALAERFRFTRRPLPELESAPASSLRPVNPCLEKIRAWISSVGAAVALNDLDGDGLPNDLCYVDTRTNSAIVAPVPGTGERYAAQALEPHPLPYDPQTMAPMGCLPGDIDEDGDVDLIVYYWGRTPIAFLREGEWYQPTEIVPVLERWFTNAATLADVDGDAHLDLIVGNYFEDGARILDASAEQTDFMQASMSRAYNGGRNRLLLWKGATRGDAPAVRFDEAEGVFDDEVARAWTLAIGTADIDADLLPEIYFANDFGPDRLLHNRSTPGAPSLVRLVGRERLDTPSSSALGNDSFKGMGVDFGDIDGDGRLDIYVSNIAAEYALLESHFAFIHTGESGLLQRGIAPYVNRSEALGLSRSSWAWESRLADLDNDGRLEALQATGFLKGEINRWPELQELAMGNDERLAHPASWPRFQPGDDLSGHAPNGFFVRSASGRFVDIAAELGLDEPEVSRGIATADVDGDGDLDFAVANQWETSYFYRNDSPGGNAFLGLHLLLPTERALPARTEVMRGHPTGTRSTRAAVGACATVRWRGGGPAVGQVDGGNGHSGKRSHELHFGLGRLADDTELLVELSWRDPGGALRHERLTLTPGWHTVVLGWPDPEAESS